MESVKFIECPRDAMQGVDAFISTRDKVDYINLLLEIGFDTIDFGSFVSPKAIPQMRDTAQVLQNLNLRESESKLLAIVANKRGAEDAVEFEEIAYLGYPFSVSETFQLRNTNATIEESVERLEDIKNICEKHDKQLVAYLSMGFGNPYGDPWNVDIVESWTQRLYNMGIRILSLSDTIGVASPESIDYLFSHLIPAFPDIEFGAHLHSPPHNWEEKVEAAWNNGCRRFDSALNGYGGCPMAKDELTGNMATENLVYFFDKQEVEIGLDRDLLLNAMEKAREIFPDTD